MTLIVMLAAVAVPGSAGSWVPSPERTPSAELFASVEMAAYVRGTETRTLPLDPSARSAGALDERSMMIEPASAIEPSRARPRAAQPSSKAVVVAL